MADEITTPVVEASAPAPAPEPTPDATASASAEPNMAAIIAELDAMPSDTGEPAAPAAGEEPKTEAEGEKVEAKTEEQTPAAEGEANPEAESVAAARRMLAAAARKERKALEAIPQAEAKLIELFKSDPRAFLARAGVSIQQWLAMVTTSGAAAEEKPQTAEDRVKVLEEREQQREIEAQQREVDQLKAQIHDTIKTKHAAEFPRLVKSGQLSLVTDVQVDYYNTHKKPLPYLVAAKQVENYLRSLDGEPPIDSTPSKKAPAPAPKATSTRPASQTLTNTSTGTAPAQGELPMDAEARYRAVLAEFDV